MNERDWLDWMLIFLTFYNVATNSEQIDNKEVLKDIHKHLARQDEKIDLILKKLGVTENEDEKSNG